MVDLAFQRERDQEQERQDHLRSRRTRISFLNHLLIAVRPTRPGPRKEKGPRWAGFIAGPLGGRNEPIRFKRREMLFGFSIISSGVQSGRLLPKEGELMLWPLLGQVPALQSRTK